MQQQIERVEGEKINKKPVSMLTGYQKGSPEGKQGKQQLSLSKLGKTSEARSGLQGSFVDEQELLEMPKKLNF